MKAALPLPSVDIVAKLHAADVAGQRFVVDVDETVLESNEAFILGKEALLNICRRCLPAVSAADVLECMERIDTGRVPSMGYTPERFAGSLRLTLESLADTHGILLSEQAMRDVEDAGLIVSEWGYPPFLGALEALVALKAAGARVAFCTKATDVAFQERKLQRWGLYELADGHGSIVPRKTSAEIADALSSLGVPGEDAGVADHPGWMVGDSLRDDIKGAGELGMVTVHVWRAPDPKRVAKVWRYDQVEGVTPTHKVRSVSELPAVVLRAMSAAVPA